MLEVSWAVLSRVMSIPNYGSYQQKLLLMIRPFGSRVRCFRKGSDPKVHAVQGCGLWFRV